MRNLLSITCFLILSVAQGQRTKAPHSHVWFSHWGDHRVHERWSLHSEFHIRRADVGVTAQQLLIRPAVNFHLHEQVMITGGYSYYENYRYGGYPIRFPTWEHHGFLQAQLSNNIGRVRLQQRYRWEHRRMAQLRADTGPAQGVFDGYLASDRFRYRLWVTLPLGTNGPWTVNAYNEAFVSLGGTVTGDRFGQNRLSGLMGYQVNKELNVMAGYLHQTINRPGAALGADLLEVNSTLHVVLVYNWAFRRATAPVVPVVPTEG